jgi:hypothetical protein
VQDNARAGDVVANLIPILIGKRGLAEGEVFLIENKKDTFIGRSRACEISFQHFRRFVALTPEEQQERESNNQSVSRKHLRLHVDGTLVTLENLSNNGSFCNDKRFDTIQHVELAKGEVTVRLGQCVEIFRLLMIEREDAMEMMAHQTRAMPGATRPPGIPLLDERPGQKSATTKPAVPAIPPQSGTVGRPPENERSVYL